jgi:hypothetical protein
MYLKSINGISSAQKCSIAKIRHTEYEEKLRNTPIGGEDRCSFGVYISPYVNDFCVYVRLKWGYLTDEYFFDSKIKYYCIDEFGVVLPLDEKYSTWGFEQKTHFEIQLQKIDWE